MLSGGTRNKINHRKPYFRRQSCIEDGLLLSQHWYALRRNLIAAVNPPAILYMGRDKVENEELIKYGFPEDVWFHVDKHSSAHVYIRLPEVCLSILFRLLTLGCFLGHHS